MLVALGPGAASKEALICPTMRQQSLSINRKKKKKNEEADTKMLHYRRPPGTPSFPMDII